MSLKKSMFRLCCYTGFFLYYYYFFYSFAQQNNLPILKHVTLPRVGALRAIMDVFDSHENKCGNNNSGTKTYVNGDITRSSEKNNQGTF